MPRAVRALVRLLRLMALLLLLRIALEHDAHRLKRDDQVLHRLIAAREADLALDLAWGPLQVIDGAAQVLFGDAQAAYGCGERSCGIGDVAEGANQCGNDGRRNHDRRVTRRTGR